MNTINESSLSRVWQAFSDPSRKAALLTAFRGEFDYETNVQRNKALSADLRNLGHGVVFVDGHWVENEGTPNERLVKEDSIFVNANSNHQHFSDDMHQLGNKYNQDAVLVKDKAGPELIFANGDRMELGPIQPGKLATIYTQIRNNKKSNTFIFEAERDVPGFIARMAQLDGIKK